MSTRTLPDIEDAVIAYLLSTHVADLVAGRIYAASPEDVAYPYLTILKVTERDTRHWIANATLQVGGWASRGNVEARATARDVCEAAVAALHDTTNYTDGSIVLGAGSVLIGPRPLYDQPTGNPRFLADMLVPYHPAPETS